MPSPSAESWLNTLYYSYTAEQNPIAAIKREWCVSLCTVIERLLKSIIKQKKISELWKHLYDIKLT